MADESMILTRRRLLQPGAVFLAGSTADCSVEIAGFEIVIGYATADESGRSGGDGSRGDEETSTFGHGGMPTGMATLMSPDRPAEATATQPSASAPTVTIESPTETPTTSPTASSTTEPRTLTATRTAAVTSTPTSEDEFGERGDGEYGSGGVIRGRDTHSETMAKSPINDYNVPSEVTKTGTSPRTRRTGRSTRTSTSEALWIRPGLTGSIRRRKRSISTPTSGPATWRGATLAHASMVSFTDQ